MRRWRTLKADEPATIPKSGQDSSPKLNLPKDGIILREVMRDLPRPVVDRHAWRHNLDHFWLSKADCLSLVPEELKEGATREVEGNFKRRLILFHLVDQVRGESSPWQDRNIEASQVETRIASVKDGQITLTLRGSARLVQKPNGEINPYSGTRVTKERGIDLKISGQMTFNRKTETFDRFDMVAVGQRWGTDVYSFRHKDPGPQPIGFAFELLPRESRNRPAPAYARWPDYQKTSGP